MVKASGGARLLVAAMTTALLLGAPSLLTQAAPAAEPYRVLGLGDSNMSGYNCFCDGPPAQYARDYSGRTGRAATSVNLAVGGWWTVDLLAALRTDDETREEVRRADVILVTIGANDMYESLDAWEASGCDEACYVSNAHEMGVRVGEVLDEVHALARPNTPVYVTGYWNVMQDGMLARLVESPERTAFNQTITVPANAAIKAAADAHGAIWVDLLTAFKGPDGAGDPTALLSIDGEHPNAAGVRRITEALLAAAS